MRALLEQLPPGVVLGSTLGPKRKVLTCKEPLASALPDGGFPRAAITELSAPSGLARGCSIALDACAAAQEEARLRGGEGAFCAFFDPWSLLNAPAVAARGVDLERLLVVRPPLSKLARTAVRVAASQIFTVVVIDLAGAPGAHSDNAPPSLASWIGVVRKLALSVERGDTAVLLLTDAETRRAAPLPVALRVELACPEDARLSVSIAKERHGRIAPPRLLAWGGRPTSEESPRERPLLRDLASTRQPGERSRSA